MLDTKVWIDLKENDGLLGDFKQLKQEQDFEIVFSIGNFLDLAIRQEQDILSQIISELTDEYLGPFSNEPSEGYHYSDSPTVLARIDPTWHRHVSSRTKWYNDTITLWAMFRDGNYDPEPALGFMTEFIEETRNLEDINLEGEIEVPPDVASSVARKKIGIFSDYVTETENGKASLQDADIPPKRYVMGMSLIYLSETNHTTEAGDYRDALIWSQAIITGCDVLWTEIQWSYEHPIIVEVMDRLNREPLEVVVDFEEFKATILE